MNNLINNCPKLSIVVTSRNDNHGGDLKHRMQLFIDGILDQAVKFKSNIELIIVEWNPPTDRLSLKEGLSWEKRNDFCDVRIIEVPNEIHRCYKYSERLPLYQMIGKNVGIRRAKGEFVLVTNIDILLSDEMFEFLCSDNLEKGKIYRVNRYDVNKDIPIAATNDDRLEYCKDNLLRVNERYCTRSFLTNEEYLVYSKEIKEICEQNNLKKPLFTNACGDFQLMAREHWFELNGYPEFDMYSMHIDSVFQYMTSYKDLDEVVLEDPMVTYHIEHSSGFQPENKKLDNRLKEDKIVSLQYPHLLALAAKMREIEAPLIFNTEEWGMAEINLNEYKIDENIHDENIGVLLNSEYNPCKICNTEEWIKKIDNEMAINMLLLNSKTFDEWIEIIVEINKLLETKKIQVSSMDKTSKYYINSNKLEKNDCNLKRVLKKKEKKVIVFGGSSAYKDFVQPVLKYYDIKPEYIIDNDKKKIGTSIEGVNILPVETILTENKEEILIIIASMFGKEIKEQLEQLGFEENVSFIKSFLYENITLNYSLACMTLRKSFNS